MKPDHLPLLVDVSSLTADPGGSRVVAATSRPDFNADSYVGQLWTIPRDGGGPHRITRGASDGAPQFSPDGRLIAFVRSVPDKGGQLAIVPAAGGEPMVITDQVQGVGEFAWFGDSTRIVFCARVPDDDRYGTTEGVGGGQENPRHFTGNQIRRNGIGWYNDRRAQLFTVEVPDPYGEPPVAPVGRAAKAAAAAKKDEGSDESSSPLVPKPTQITHGDNDWSSPVVAPDGGSVVATSAAHPTREEDLVTDLYRIELSNTDAEPVRLTNLGEGDRLGAEMPCFSADGQHLFFIGADLGTGVDFIGHHGTVWVMPAAGGDARQVTDPDLDVAFELRPSGPDAVLCVVNHEGSGQVLRVRPDGTAAVVLDHATWSAAEVVQRPGTDQVVVTATSPVTTGDVVLVDGPHLRQLTDFCAPLRAATTVVEPVEIEATAADGYRVHGWVLTPPGDGPHPVLLNIHGGPYASYGRSFFDEFQTYVEAGYAVVACNPRGAGGYGSAHGQAIKGDFGNLDMTDVLTFLDHATSTVKGLDAGRVGVMGGSYGGYLTAWIIAHDHRFAGAIVERGFLDPWSFVGSSDIGWFFPGEYNGREREQMDRQSPMVRAGDVTTPTLVLHSEQDLRCPLSQGLQYYTMLKQAGVDAELLVFPGENHELSRSGTPWHRKQRFEAILDFWGRHLPV